MKRKSQKLQKRQEPVSQDTESGEVLDRMDRRILDLLQDNNQITNLELAHQVGLSPPPCLRRVKRLRGEGIISRDVALVDPFKVGQNLIVFVSVNMEKLREDLLIHFERKMSEQDEVLQCYFVSGTMDYLLVVNVADMNHYNEFARKVLANEHNVRLFNSSFCLSRIKYETKITLSKKI